MLQERREAKLIHNYYFAPFWQPMSTFRRKEQNRSSLNKCSFILLMWSFQKGSWVVSLLPLYNQQTPASSAKNIHLFRLDQSKPNRTPQQPQCTQEIQVCWLLKWYLTKHHIHSHIPHLNSFYLLPCVIDLRVKVKLVGGLKLQRTLFEFLQKFFLLFCHI